MKMRSCTIVLTALAIGLAAPRAHADAILTINTLAESEMVGQNDADESLAPAAPGDGWYTGAYAGTIRARAGGDGEQLRTQWYFRFDLSALDGIDPDRISAATLSLPQIGRLNNTGSTAPMRLFDTNVDWDLDGSNYPIWNEGRESPTGSGTLIENFGAIYSTFGTATDTSDTDVEGTFTTSSAALLATVKTWADDPVNDEGLLLTFAGPGSAGLAFGTPTLELTIIPAPAALPAGLAMIGLAAARRKRRN